MIMRSQSAGLQFDSRMMKCSLRTACHSTAFRPRSGWSCGSTTNRRSLQSGAASQSVSSLASATNATSRRRYRISEMCPLRRPLCSSASQLLWRSVTSHGRASSATARRVRAKQLALSLPNHTWRTITWRDGSSDPLRLRFARVRVRTAPIRGAAARKRRC